MAKILVIHGPNLHYLPHRESQWYGNESLDNIDTQLHQLAHAQQHELFSEQSNAEHELIDIIHQAALDKVNFMIFNPAAFTHTSIALRDAVLGADIPFIEVHLSNVHAREEFRQFSYFSDIALGTIGGFGANSYYLALNAAHYYLSQAVK